MKIGLEDGREKPPIADAIRGTVHAVQFYETDDYLLQTLADYVAGALAAGDAAIVVATGDHRTALDDRLIGRGIDLQQARDAGTYFALDAKELLARFTVDGSISPTRFAEIVGGLITQARGESGPAGRDPQDPALRVGPAVATDRHRVLVRPDVDADGRHARSSFDLGVLASSATRPLIPDHRA